MYKNRRTIDYFGGYSGQGMCGGGKSVSRQWNGAVDPQGNTRAKARTPDYHNDDWRQENRRNGRLMWEEGCFYGENSRKSGGRRGCRGRRWYVRM